VSRYDGRLDTAWTDGTITVRPGESIAFEGDVTGVSLHDDEDIRLVFHADDRGTYQFAKGSLDGFVPKHIQAVILKHVEQGLMDDGFTIDPVVASEDYEP